VKFGHLAPDQLKKTWLNIWNYGIAHLCEICVENSRSVF